MNARSKQRLQRFLTIADTVHDFCDLGRYPLEDPLDRRRELKERIMASMISDLYAFVRTELDEVRKHPENEEAQRLLPIYESVFEESMSIPKGMDNEETVVDIIKRSFSAYGVNYSTEGEYYKKLTLNEESTADLLYEELSVLSGKRFVKYTLDKNQADNNLFCVNPDIIQFTTDISAIEEEVRPFVFKSRYKGLFHSFDNHRETVTYEECSHKDIVEYKITKDQDETLMLKTLGVEKTQIYRLFLSVGDNDNTPIQFKHNQEHKGLTLFLTAINELTKYKRADIEIIALHTIDKVFGIRCERYKEIYKELKRDSLYVPLVSFQKCLYDLKRGMDYLPVKATKNANNVFSKYDMIYFYVSSDRLAVAYALLQGCPCIYVERGGLILHVYNYRSPSMTGGRISKHQFHQRKPVKQEMSLSKQESYDLFMRLFIDDIVPSNTEQDEPFDKFLRRYKDTYQEPYIGFFWYITYKFLFFWCNQS